MEIINFLPPERWKVIMDLAEIELDKYHSSEKTRSGHYVNFLDEDIIPETNNLFNDFDFPHRPYKGKLKKLVQWAISPSGWNYPPHCDNKSRISTTIIYVAPEKSDGTVLCKNPSSNDDGDHGAADRESIYTKEIQWEPNKAFFHNSIPNETWHSIKNTHSEPRITLNAFLVQPDLVAKDRCYTGHEIDI